MRKFPMPCILHWDQNHFVVLYRVKEGQMFYVADPGKGRVAYEKRKTFTEIPDAVFQTV